MSRQQRAVRILTLLVAAGAALLSGCRHETIQPFPGLQPTTGLLLQREVVPLGMRLKLERYRQLRTDISNDFYPFNIPCTTPGDRMVSKLFVLSGVKWKEVDFVNMPLAESYAAANVSPDGRRIVYERPDVTSGEGDWPRAYSRQRRTRRVAIYHVGTGRRYVLPCFTELYGLSHESFWRTDGKTLAATITCEEKVPGLRGLIVLDSVGKVLLDPTMMPELLGLEFIAHGPDGRIAALRPNDPGEHGGTGGVLVEVDTNKRTAEEIARIPGDLASRHVGRMDELIRWTGGHLELKK